MAGISPVPNSQICMLAICLLYCDAYNRPLMILQKMQLSAMMLLVNFEVLRRRVAVNMETVCCEWSSLDAA
jgi:hypothetical protein